MFKNKLVGPYNFWSVDFILKSGLEFSVSCFGILS